MNNKLIVGLLLGCTLLIGFAAGRFTAAPDPLLKEAGDKTAGKSKQATTKRTGAYRVPHAETANTAPEAPPEGDSTNRFGRGRRDSMLGLMGGGSTNFVAAMKERATAERASFIANANLTPAQQADFDDLVGAMNNSLKQRAEKLTEMMKDGKPPNGETFLRMTHDFSSSMMHAYEMMDRTMPGSWREKAGSSFNMMTFIDPSLRDSMRAFRPSRGERGTGGGAGGPPPP